MKKHLIFKCRKCGHEIYTNNPRKLFGYDCPECGEEWFDNYILYGEGKFPNETNNNNG